MIITKHKVAAIGAVNDCEEIEIYDGKGNYFQFSHTGKLTLNRSESNGFSGMIEYGGCSVSMYAKDNCVLTYDNFKAGLVRFSDESESFTKLPPAEKFCFFLS